MNIQYLRINDSKKEKQWKFNNLLNEKLVKATIEQLNKEMLENSDLYHVLNTPLKDLDPKYLNMFPASIEHLIKDLSISYFIKDDLQKKLSTVALFSENSRENLQGIITYGIIQLGVLLLILVSYPSIWIPSL